MLSRDYSGNIAGSRMSVSQMSRERNQRVSCPKSTKNKFTNTFTSIKIERTRTKLKFIAARKEQ